MASRKRAAASTSENENIFEEFIEKAVKDSNSLTETWLRLYAMEYEELLITDVEDYVQKVS
jgi:hypothetical protein